MLNARFMDYNNKNEARLFTYFRKKEVEIIYWNLKKRKVGKKLNWQNMGTGQLYHKILVPYLNNTSEEGISESSQIKE